MEKKMENDMETGIIRYFRLNIRIMAKTMETIIYMARIPHNP